MRINHNISALNTFSQLSKNEAAQTKSIQQLSSGKRINGASDDAAGLSISQKMQAQLRGLDQANRNSQDGISMIQTADGALGTVQNILTRMRELAVQGSNDSNSTDERAAIGNELTELGKNIKSIQDTTKFNGQGLLDGTGGSAGDGKFEIQTGANKGEVKELDFSTDGINLGSVLTAVGTLTSANVKDSATATALIDTIDQQIQTVSSGRSTLGAFQNSLEYTSNNLDTISQNLTGAESRITDVDMAQAVMENSKNGILTQAAQAMLSQANQQPQSVLQLLRG